MKKFKTMFAMMLALVGMCVAFTACSSDDDEATPAAQEIAGTYTDDMTLAVMGESSTYEDVTFSVAAASETTVNITLPAVGSGMMALPSITLQGVKVSGSGSTVTISEQEMSGTITNASGAEKAYTCTIAGSYTNGKLMLNYSLQYGNMPMAMVCAFTGTKK